MGIGTHSGTGKGKADVLRNVYIISMKGKEGKSRRMHFKAEAAREKLKFEFFDATDRKKIPYEAMLKAGAHFRKLAGHRELKDFEIAAADSHRRIYKMMIDSNMPLALVFEDDAELCHDFCAKVKALELPVDFDVVKLEDWRARFRSVEESYLCPRREIPIISDKGGGPGTAAYIISLSGAKKLYSANTPIWMNADGIMDLRHLNKIGLEAINLYQVIPALARQIPFDNSSAMRRFGRTGKKFFRMIIEHCAKTVSRQQGEYYGLGELDKKLKAYIKKKRGFFIELGANDGIAQSNTLWFEKHKKWSGILIEAVPELYKKCKKNRPNCRVLNYACVEEGYPDDFIRLRYANLTSVVENAMESEELKEHLKSARKFCQQEQYAVDVTAQTLSTLLKESSVRHIDFLSLDVEGYELNVLKGLDFNKWQPHFILVEQREENGRAIKEYLTERGYKLICNLSGFTYENNPQWDGSTNDFLYEYEKIKNSG